MEKTRLIESGSKHNLAEDLWREILSWLPVRSLLRFRCVSKSWQSLIDDPDFWRLHLNHFKNNCHQTHLFVYQGDYMGGDCVVRCSNTFKTTARLASLGRRERLSFNFARHPTSGYPGKWEVVCSVDGLVMLSRDVLVLPPPTELLLWNPSIRKFRSLPPSPKISNGVAYNDMGLGFDPLIKDYKHVRLARHLDGYVSRFHSIAVFTVRLGTWRTIQLEGKECSSWRWSSTSFLGLRSIYFRSCLCFIANSRDSDAKELVSFDLSSEVFASTRLPLDQDLDYPNYSYPELVTVAGGCSLVKLNFLRTQGSVWMLEGSRTDSQSMCWNKRYSFTTNTRIGECLYLKKNGDLLEKEEIGLISHNIETRKEKFLMKSTCRLENIKIFDYIESLILLK